MTTDQRPPIWARKFLHFFLKPELVEEVTGDLDEEFQKELARSSLRRARWRYCYQVLHYLRPFALRNFLTSPQDFTIMYRHNFLISWRSIMKNKFFSLINIGGLALGMAVTMLISLWIREEVTYDRFHENYDHIYQVIAHRDFNGNIFTDRNMVFPLAQAIEDEIPEVDQAVWMTHVETVQMSDGVTSTQQRGHHVGGPFFTILSWKFIHGSAENALTHPSSIVITESLAKTYFSEENPVGKTLDILNQGEVQVSAVVEDPPSNSSISFDFIRPFNMSDPNIKRLLGHWNNYSWNVLVASSPKVNMDAVDQSITEIMERHTEDKKSSYFTFPMRDWHLRNHFVAGERSGGLIQYVRLFGAVAAIILIIACINFMNLSTARSESRATEVAIRKTLGSARTQLMQQFFSETLLLSLLAFVVATGMVYLILPYFNLIAETSLTVDPTHPLFWLASFVLILCVSGLAGSYPALFLSGFKPVAILKGEKSVNSGGLPRGVLVVFQFVASIALIAGTLVVYQQIDHVKNRDIGYNPDNLIMVPGSTEKNKQYDVIKEQLLQTGKVEAVTRTRSPITQIWWRSPAPDWPGRPPETDILFSGTTCHLDFIKTTGIHLIQGRDFSGTPADTSSVLLNQAAIEAMQLDNPVGKQIRYGDPFTIIGVMENAIMESPYEAVSPLMVFYVPEESGYIHLRLKSGTQPREALASIKPIFAEADPEMPFEYQFVDAEFGEKFAHEERISKIIGSFAAIAIFICCLGLLGMASFTVQKRTKEIAVRKVLGATIGQVLLLISRDFLKLVLLAFAIALPITYYLTYNWLLNYEYRMTLNPALFILVGVFVMVLSLGIVSLNTIRAARANPVDSLHTD